MLLGIACQATAQVQDAERKFGERQYDAALASVDAVLYQNSRDAEALELKGRIHRELAYEAEGEARVLHLKKMVEAYGQAAQIDQRLAGPLERDLDLTYFNVFRDGVEAFTHASHAQDSSRHMQAVINFRGAAVVRPDSVEAYINWAFAEIQSGNTRGAIEPLEIALEKGDMSTDIIVYLGGLYISDGRTTDAVLLFEEGTGRFPEDETLRVSLLDAYVRSNQAHRALAILEELVVDSPDDPVARYNYGSLLLETEQYPAAIAQFEESVRLLDTYTNAHYNLGAAYFNYALAIIEEADALEARVREEASSHPELELRELEEAIAALHEESQGVLAQAAPPFERFRALSEPGSTDAQLACEMLLEVYVRTGQVEKAESVLACAGG